MSEQEPTEELKQKETPSVRQQLVDSWQQIRNDRGEIAPFNPFGTIRRETGILIDPAETIETILKQSPSLFPDDLEKIRNLKAKDLNASQLEFLKRYQLKWLLAQYVLEKGMILRDELKERAVSSGFGKFVEAFNRSGQLKSL